VDPWDACGCSDSWPWSPGIRCSPWSSCCFSQGLATVTSSVVCFGFPEPWTAGSRFASSSAPCGSTLTMRWPGRFLVEAGRPSRALTHLEAAHARAPEVPQTTYYLGAARLGVGDTTAGRALIEEAL